MRRLIRPTGFVDSPFGHDGKVARLAGGLNWFASVELLTVEDGKRTTAELLPVEGLESRFDDILAAQWKALTGSRASLQLGDRMVRQIMKPRIDIDALDVNTTQDVVLGAIAMAGFSRLPVYEGDLDHIIGFIFLGGVDRAIEGRDQLLHAIQLLMELAGRLGAAGLVRVIHLVTKRRAGQVESDRDIFGMLLVDHVQQNRSKAEHSVGRLAVRGAQPGLGERVERTEGQRVAVDQRENRASIGHERALSSKQNAGAGGSIPCLLPTDSTRMETKSALPA